MTADPAALARACGAWFADLLGRRLIRAEWLRDERVVGTLWQLDHAIATQVRSGEAVRDREPDRIVVLRESQ